VRILCLAFGGLDALFFVLYVFFVSRSFNQVALYIHADSHKVNLLAYSTKLVIRFVAL
jgi:hypothetical protein